MNSEKREHLRVNNLANEVRDLIEKLLFEGYIDIMKGYEIIKNDVVKDFITDYRNGDSSSVCMYCELYEWKFEDGELHLEWEVRG